ncbi:T9SS type A sorting domain-containing protein [bacterium SCSIO 12643]|nr:T9SS type A sorting domain-containing protein [bacterium SCSIO 12643]
MKKVSLILMFVVINIAAFSQYQNYHIKEHFDKMFIESYQNRTKYDYTGYELQLGGGSGLASRLSSAWCPALEALLTMYETTKDKAYLYAFMKESTQIINSRRDYVYGSNHYPLWFRDVDYNNNVDATGNGLGAAFNGRVLLVLAHFNYIVKKDWYLQNTPIELYPGEDRNTLYKNYYTFGAYANWVEKNVDQTLKWAISWNNSQNMNNMWYNDSECLNKSGMGHNFANEAMAEFNHQTPWAIAFLYMYLSNVNNYYLYGQRAVDIAKLIMGNGCDEQNCGWTAQWPTSNALKYNFSTGAYWWRHNPWNACSYTFTEDMGHATWDIMFPLLYNKNKSLIYNHVTTGQYFENFHMERFRNTFTKNIWDNNYVCCGGQVYDGFHMGVDGTTQNNIYTDFMTFTFDDPKARLFGLAWTPLYKFDNSGSNTAPNVYNIIMDLYGAYIKYHNDASVYYITEGMRMKGWGDMVAAHWDKECYSLYLSNRYCYFDQDFYAKDNLYVGYENSPYQADDAMGNKNYSGGDFVIQSGVKVVFEAGGQVFFGPNFVVEPGGEYEVINHNSELCLEKGEWKKGLSINETEIFKELSIYPNPASEQLSIELSGVNSSLISEIYMTDAVGKRVNVGINKTQIGNDSKWTLQTNEIPNGIYILSFVADGFIHNEKVIIQHK